MPNRNIVNSNSVNADAVFVVGDGNLLSITQNVQFEARGDGNLCSIEQEVEAQATGDICSIGQNVIVNTNTFYNRNGWYMYLYIDGNLVPDNQISGPITITRTEDDAASMSFVLIPPRGAIDLKAYEGKDVYLNVQTATGYYRAYTGRINTPSLDLNLRTLTVSCTDDRRTLINEGGYAALVRGIGYYDSTINARSAVDLADELDERLATVTQTLNFDAYQNPVVSSSFAKATPDYTFYEQDVYRENGRDPQLIIAPRSKIVNTVNIDYSYRYMRLYNAQAFYSWDNYPGGDLCEFVINGYDVCTREAVRQAAEGTGWTILNDITYTPVLAAGFYTCGGFTIAVTWTQTQFATVPATETTRDSGGNIVTNPILDSSGQPVYYSRPISSIDYSSVLCFGAEWAMQKRFAQNVTEAYDLTVTAPQSVAKFGVVDQGQTGGVDSTYNVEDWINAPNYTTGIGHGYTQEYTNFLTYQNGITTALNRAKTTIKKSHRAHKVIFNKFIDPRIQLHHTVKLDTEAYEGTTILAKGKVYQLIHTLNPTTGNCNTEVTLALSVAEGSQAETTLSIPARPNPGPNLPTIGANLESHYGEEPDPSWTGFIGNKWITEPVANPGGQTITNHRKTAYPQLFVVDSPAIDVQFTANKTLNGSASYNVAIVNDLLTIEL